MVGVSSETEWNDLGSWYDVVQLTDDLTFTALPAPLTIGSSVRLDGDGHTMTHAYDSFSGLVILNGGTVSNLNIAAGTNTVGNNHGFLVRAASQRGTVIDVHITSGLTSPTTAAGFWVQTLETQPKVQSFGFALSLVRPTACGGAMTGSNPAYVSLESCSAVPSDGRWRWNATARCQDHDHHCRHA